MSANFLNTNRNANRFFFATSENGEQQLGLQFGTTGGTPNLSTMAVTITGDQGNGVIVNQAPSFQATDYIFAEQGLGVYGSTYFTPSTLTTTINGINLTSDRFPGTGLACIESYSGNGAYKGFEFLTRGVNSALQSTVIDSYLSTIGSPGAVAKLGGDGQFVAGQGVVAPVAVSLSVPDSGAGGVGCLSIYDLSGGNPYGRWSFYKYNPVGPGNTGSDLALGAYDNNGTFLNSCLTATRSTGQIATINGYNYPQAVVSIAPSAVSPGPVTVGNATPTVIITIPASGAGLVSGANYLTDINITITATNPLAVPVFLQIGVRLGGNGAFNYENPLYLAPGVGLPVTCAVSVNQISDMGNSSTNIDIIAYQQSSAPGNITVTATTSSASPPHLLKMIT